MIGTILLSKLVVPLAFDAFACTRSTTYPNLKEVNPWDTLVFTTIVRATIVRNESTDFPQGSSTEGSKGVGVSDEEGGNSSGDLGRIGCTEITKVNDKQTVAGRDIGYK